MSNKSIFLKGAFLSYLSIIIGMIISLVSLPMTLNYFGKEQYGLWVLIFTLIGYLNMTNFGIPFASSVMMAKISNNFEKYLILKKSFVLLTLISLLTFVTLFFISIFFHGWIAVVGNLSPELVNLAKQTVIVMLIFFLIKAPLMLVSYAFTSFQKIHIQKVYEIITVILSFISLLITIYLKKDLVFLAYLTSITSILVAAASIMHFFLKFKHIKTEESFAKDNVSYKSIFSSGFYFFQTGIVGTIIWSTDNLVISHFLDVASVAPYAVAFRIFNLAFLIFIQVCGVLNPMYGKAYSENNWNWMQKTYKLTCSTLPIIAGAIWILGILVMKDFITLWTHKSSMFGGYFLMFALGAYGYVLSLGNIHYSILVSLNLTKYIYKLSWLEAGANLVLSIIMLKLFGIGGVAFGTALASLFIPFIFLPKYIRKLSDNKLNYSFMPVIRHFTLVVMPLLVASFAFVKFYPDVAILIKIMVTLVILALYLLLSWTILPEDIKSQLIEKILPKGKIYALSEE